MHLFNHTHPVVCSLLLWSAGHHLLHAQFSEEQMQSLAEKTKNGGDPHEIAGFASSAEDNWIKGDEATKIKGTQQAVELAARIYETHDPRVPIDRSVGLWPKFWVDGKPLFAGTSPESVKDPKVRAEYQKALADHNAMLLRMNKEMYKLQEADDCLRVAKSIIASSADPESIRNAVVTHIIALQLSPGTRERLKKSLDLVGLETTDSATDPSIGAAAREERGHSCPQPKSER